MLPKIDNDAKKKEFLAFNKEFDVYETIPDNCQFRVSTTRVNSKKVIDGKHVIKARLVALSFEEITLTQDDSSTCTQDAFRIFLAVAALRGLVIESMNIKSAFLQDKLLSRETFVQPPKEADVNSILLTFFQEVYVWIN